MFQFAKAPRYLLLSALLTTSLSAVANNATSLPDIGTTAASTLTIDKEIKYGDMYMQMMRASRPMINDPVLSEYIQDLGHKLVANADGVKTPFNFFLIQNYEINAFALFGGNIGVHSGLFLHAKTESELASVIAHEIAHVTQRHLARTLEDQAKKNPATMAALIGSLLLVVAAPEAGMAALHTTTAVSMQGMLNHTRSNEKEADRIGIATLAKAGFNPQAMPHFFGRLAEQYRYTTQLPAMLLSHPLPESRITDSRMRANNYPKVKLPPSERYLLAKSRIVARNIGFSKTSALNWFNAELKKATPTQRQELNYGKGLVYLDSGQYAKAQQLLLPLISAEPNNLFYIDAMTDLDLYKKQSDKAIARLEKALQYQPESSVLQLNLANVLLEAKHYQQSLNILTRYSYQHPNDINGWALLAQNYAKQNQRAGELAAMGELAALRAQWKLAISNYTQAAQQATLGSLDQARYDARLDQLRVQQAQFEALRTSF
ncbi:M48 family metalloprotease [Photobacterium phosphoreum]|uniref:beta-barrel assembly-enhancing protease n=1 Tax=Photobacterium phosphoreum TaxID=659 RepID=UPI001E44A733|nr:M48 family metalloprotease [Photobacterium phosphoreum]MCD9504358.1 M48 family metalloprotease [Photobacterium phosphoreum]